MSHIVTIETEVRDASAVQAACERLKLPAAAHGLHELFSGTAQGLAVRLPGWTYPAVCNLKTGKIEFDNYRRPLGQPTGTGSIPAGLRRRKGQNRSPPQGLLGHRASPR